MLKKSKLLFYHQLHSDLLEIPALVNRLERKDSAFIPELFDWMRRAEEHLLAYRSRQAAEVAGIRSRILAGRHDEGHGIAKRKLQWKAASDSLFALQEVLQEVCVPLERQLDEARELIRQLFLIVAQTGAFVYNSKNDFDAFLQEIWKFICGNEQLRAGAVKLKTLLSAEDIRLLMAEEINLEDFSASGRNIAGTQTDTNTKESRKT
jgi:hypothetical protein